jgi:hypothetical protein
MDLADAGHAPGLAARGARRPRLATAAGWLAAAPERAEPPHGLAAARAVLDRALAILVTCRRLAAGRKRRPTAAIIDTRSVRTGPQRGPRGYDAHKKIRGQEAGAHGRHAGRSARRAGDIG